MGLHRCKMGLHRCKTGFGWCKTLRLLERPLLPGPKRPFAPSPNHFWEFTIFGLSPRTFGLQLKCGRVLSEQAPSAVAQKYMSQGKGSLLSYLVTQKG